MLAELLASGGGGGGNGGGAVSHLTFLGSIVYPSLFLIHMIGVGIKGLRHGKKAAKEELHHIVHDDYTIVRKDDADEIRD